MDIKERTLRQGMAFAENIKSKCGIAAHICCDLDCFAVGMSTSIPNLDDKSDNSPIVTEFRFAGLTKSSISVKEIIMKHACSCCEHKIEFSCDGDIVVVTHTATPKK